MAEFLLASPTEWYYDMLRCETIRYSFNMQLRYVIICCVIFGIELDITQMDRVIDGTKYFSATDVARDLGISRQTLWRWRKEGKIPLGHRFRDRQVMFTEGESLAIKDFANHIEPIAERDNGQLRLFNGTLRGE